MSVKVVRKKSGLWLLPLGALALMLPGCMFGPTAVKMGHGQYNEALRLAGREQLLLNLVRLKYRDSPLFMDTPSVSAQFEVSESAEVTGTINEGPTRFANDSLKLFGGMKFSERPTVTFVPLRGDDFVKRMLSPLSLETITLLTQSGWSVERVMRLTVQQINGLSNAQSASGPTPDAVPSYEGFIRLAKLMRLVQKNLRVSLVAYRARTATVAEGIPADRVDATDLLAAAKMGYRFSKSEDAPSYALTQVSQVPVLRLGPHLEAFPEISALRELMGLDADLDEYELLVGTSDPLPAESRGSWDKVVLTPRSLLGAMFYASQGIDVPTSHIKNGLVTITRDEAGRPFDWQQLLGDLLRVHSSRVRPNDAAVAVRYRSHWFFIDDADLESKSTFTLLMQLFELQAGTETTGAPILTLPLN